MQRPEWLAAMRRAFEATREEMGEAALRMARSHGGHRPASHETSLQPIRVAAGQPEVAAMPDSGRPTTADAPERANHLARQDTYR